jgi:putative PIN family toxin of toxin-antitoxin system
MPKICIVLDTNVLLSGTAYPNSIPGKIVSARRCGSLEVILSKYILDELQRVLPRLNHRLDWSSLEIRDFVDSLAFLADLVDPVPAAEPLLRDEADQPVLGTFLAANANYLVTGDKDLLALSALYPIVTPVDFWQLHGD